MQPGPPLHFPLHVRALFLRWCNSNLFPRCRLSDRHTWAWVCWILENLCVDNQDEVIILHSIHLEQNISPPFCSHLTIALIQERSIYTYGTQRTAIKFKIQLFFFFLTIDCFGNHTFSSMPSSTIIPLSFPFVMGCANKVCCKSQYAYSKILNNTTLHLVLASWCKNHKL